ncbi:MAG: phospho-sugar mutase [Verrucomicrobiae bacterium]|nr:phospho-sugar mutase [Verrucomicrobiae bacterium]
MSLVSRHLHAAEFRHLVPAETARNINHTYTDPHTPEWVRACIAELVLNREWAELNNRFFKRVTFGTGGIRGRTIGHIVTAAERGSAPATARPEHPAAGTNTLNEMNIERAVRGLCRYLLGQFPPSGPGEKLRIVFGHDTRHFSREFADLAAQTAARCGLDAYLFESDRPTPELSFAIRQLGAKSGGVVTASHNPAHDNGLKVYFDDGAQIVEPHATGIIHEVNSPTSRENQLPQIPGEVYTIGPELDEEYRHKVASLVLDPAMVSAQGPSLKIVYSPLHGTGARFIPDLLAGLGLSVERVEEQMSPDGNFPTVASPNPENAEALTLALARAERTGADLVIATDPDTDRMGAAARDASGKMLLLTGNQIGALMAFYRTQKLLDLGVLTPENKTRACLIKTVVTTDLQKAIAAHFGVKLIETLTGFKYIGQKLRQYEEAVRAAKSMTPAEYRLLSEGARRDLLLKYGTYCIFGGEESYGYSAGDFVRDKDANAAAVMFCEVAAFAKSRNQSLPEMLDDIYMSLGYFTESLGQITLEGAEGAARIRKIVSSYENNPPVAFGSHAVEHLRNFDSEEIRDADGDVLPREKMFLFTLRGGDRFAVRASGTEPKVKFYFFGQCLPAPGKKFTPEELARAKAETPVRLESLWQLVREDAQRRGK